MKPAKKPNETSGSSDKPIRIVPDANVLFSDPFLEGVAAQSIIAAAQFMDIRFIVSAVTLDEVRNLVTEQLDVVTSELDRSKRRAKALHLKTGLPEYGLGYQTKKALETWGKRWETLIHTSPMLPYPKIGTKELAQRSIEERRPFLKGDKGLRDYLLWTSILAALAADNSDFILVSNDNGFYEGESHKPHPDLEEELASLGWTGRVMFRRSFAAVVEEFIKPRLKPDEAVHVAIQSGAISDFTDQDDKVAILINEYLMKTEIPGEWVTSSDYYSADFDVAEDVTMTELVSTLGLDNKVLATSEWEASVVIEVSCPGYQDESETVIVKFTIESLIDPKTLEVESHEVTECNLAGWYDPKTRERINY